MSSQKLKAAVVGVGYLGSFHTQKYLAHPDVDLVAVCDLNKDQAEKVGKEYKLPYLSTPQDLLGKVDLVTIASTTKSHFGLAKFFLTNGVHVNVEKPMTVHAYEAQELVDLAKEKNLTLTVGHVERFNPAFIELQRHIKNKPLFLEFNRMSPFRARGADVSVVHDLMIHDIDLMLTLAGDAKVVSIVATGSKFVTDTYDMASSTFKFDNGLVAQINVSRVAHQVTRSIRILEDKEYFIAYLNTGEIEKFSKTDSKENPVKVEHIAVPKADALMSETDTFIKAVQGKSPIKVTGEQALKAMKLMDQIVDEINKNHG